MKAGDATSPSILECEWLVFVRAGETSSPALFFGGRLATRGTSEHWHSGEAREAGTPGMNPTDGSLHY